MRRGKRSASDRARSRLLDLWQRRPEYGAPLGCIATTYTFDAAFFEDHCLGRFVGMETARDEDDRAYLIEREEKLSEVFSAVLVDASHVPTHRSLRWHVFPVSVPNGGLLHAKLSLLVWENHVRALIGSANLSEPAYRINLEKVGVLDFTPDGAVPRALLEELLAFVEATRASSPGAAAEGGAQAKLAGFLASVRAHTRRWRDTSWPRGEPWAALAITGPGRPSLFTRLRELWPFAPATHAFVVSPFFDRGERALETARGLESILIQRDQVIEFLVAGRRHADDRVELDIPSSLRSSTRPRTTYLFAMVTAGEGEELRPLHAKSIWLQRDRQALYCLGSSNFTQPGTGNGPPGAPAHIELNLVYVLPSLDHDFARVCDQTYPAWETIVLEDEDVSFLEPGESSAETAGTVPLPACFQTATVVSGPSGLRLQLELDGEGPDGFAIALPGGETILTSVAWEAAGRPPICFHELGAAPPPSFLGVVWSRGLEALRAIWPVNVSDPALLPAPADLRELSLEDLLTVLTSARPVHETIARLQKQREARRNKAAGIEIDPHKKIDTGHHLLQRMRRAATAMEELRARLERPTFSLDVLRGRLHGPLGPMSLASKLVAEEPVGAAFMIAELATTIASARLDPRGELGVANARAEVATVVRQLQELAYQYPAPANLRSYIDVTFREVLS